MKWTATITKPEQLSFVIQPETFHNASTGEEFIWYYLYVYQNGNDIYDYLQPTLEIAKNFALTKFQVPLDAWIQADPA